VNSYEQARVDLLITTLDEARREESRAASALDRAEQTLSARRDQHARMAGQYAAEPTEANAAQLIRARDERDVAEIPRTAAQRELERRQESVRIADVALTDAHATLDARNRADKIATLHGDASPERLAAAIAEHLSNVEHAYAVIKASAAAVECELAASRARSSELRSLGEISADVAAFHLVGPFVERAVQKRPELARKFIALLDPRDTAGTAMAHRLEGGLAPLVKIPLLEQLHAVMNSSDPIPADDQALDELRAFLSGKTIADAIAARDAIARPPEPPCKRMVSSGPLPSPLFQGSPPTQTWLDHDGAI
jgi:hypothetical protein